MQSFRYDENLNDNRFFKTLRDKHTSIYEVAKCSRSTIFVPCSSSLSGVKIDDEFVGSHIVSTGGKETVLYNTLNHRILNICDNDVATGEGFEHRKHVNILFEETYFNDSNLSYLLICISEPLHLAPITIGHDSYLTSSVKCYADSVSILFEQKDGEKYRKIVDRTIASFKAKLENELISFTLTELVDSANNMFTLCMQILMRNPLLKQAGHDAHLIGLLRRSLEDYATRALSPALFRRVSDCAADRDESLNRVTLGHRHIRIRDLGIPTEFCRNIPKARKQLSTLSNYCTPISKLNILKCAVKSLHANDPSSTGQPSTKTMTTDDLLPIVIFLVIKMQLPNWWANLMYMQHFNFSKANIHDEIGFHLACLEAALSHVTSDLVLLSPSETSQGIPLTCTSQSLWCVQDQEFDPTEKYFQCIIKDDMEGVKQCLFPEDFQNVEDSDFEAKHQLCHPLCMCRKCGGGPGGVVKLRTSRKRITTATRDSRGYTGLQICAELGHVTVCEYLLSLECFPAEPKTSCSNTTSNRSSDNISFNSLNSSLISVDGSETMINAKTYNGSTSLHLACQYGHQCIALLLLHYGASMELQDSDGNTPIHVATINGHQQCLSAILYESRTSPATLDVQNVYGDTALHYASKWGFYSMADLLLEHGASADLENRRRITPGTYALSNHMIRLINAYASQQRMNKRHYNIPMQKNNSMSTMNNLQLRPVNQNTPPAIASTPPHSQTVKLFVNREKKSENSVTTTSNKHVDRKNYRNIYRKDNKDPSLIEKLLRTIANGDMPMAKHFLGWSDDEVIDSIATQSKRILCHPLCQCSECEPVNMNYDNEEFNVNTRNDAGFTSLHVAAQYGRLEMCEMLLKRGADHEAVTEICHYRPLHLACKHGHCQVIALLLQYNVDSMACTLKGDSTYDLCSTIQARQALLNYRSIAKDKKS